MRKSAHNLSVSLCVELALNSLTHSLTNSTLSPPILNELIVELTRLGVPCNPRVRGVSLSQEREGEKENQYWKPHLLGGCVRILNINALDARAFSGFLFLCFFVFRLFFPGVSCLFCLLRRFWARCRVICMRDCVVCLRVACWPTR